MDDERMQYISAGGSVITKAKRVYRSVLGREVRVEENADLYDSVVFDRGFISRNASLNRVIVEAGIVIPEGCVIGYDFDDDKRRNIFIAEDGTRVVYSQSMLT
jgi:ADP-glucose pyrophosphorylase